MKTAFATVGVLLFALVLAFNANSDEPKIDNGSRSVNTSELGKELLDTLALNYKQRLALFNAGQSTPDRLIEVNRELYDAQRGTVPSSQQTSVAEAFLSRAKEIEAIAEERVRNGLGPSMEVLDAKASRIRATLEHATVAAEPTK